MEMESGTAFTTKIFKNESRAYFWGRASKNQKSPTYKPPQHKTKNHIFQNVFRQFARIPSNNFLVYFCSPVLCGLLDFQ